MSNIKRIIVVVVIIVAVLLISSSFVGSNIMDRAIIIGLGVDACEEGVRLTAEVVSPGSSGEKVGTFSKTVSASAQSVGQAIQRIAELTGKEASLGRCLILILGQELYETQDFSDVIDYFINSDSFKESSAIACCQGSAEQIINKGSVLMQSVSLAVTALIQDQANKTAIVTNNVLEYALSQRDMLKTGFINKVKYVQSDNSDPQNPDKDQGYFALDEIAVFRQNKLACMLDREEMRGFSLFEDSVLGDTFSSEASGKLLTLNINSKKVDKKLKDGEITVKIKLFAKLARNDSADIEGIFIAQDAKEIPKETIADVTEQVRVLAQALLDKQTEYNFDVLGLHELYRQSFGTSKELENKPMDEFKVNLEVEIKEK